MSFALREYLAPDLSAARFQNAPDAALASCPADGVAPFSYHATSIFPEYFKVGGSWLLIPETRMDCVAVLEAGAVRAREFRNLKRGDLVFCGRNDDGSEGIFVHEACFPAADGGADDAFAFRRGRSRETAYTKDYDELCALLEYERENGFVVWVLGPACAFDAGSRAAFAALARGGYVHAVLTGNALVTHDLEAAWLGTGLGQDVYTGENRPNGHYNHLDTLNRVRACGSIEKFVESEKLTGGIVCTLLERDIPLVAVGSVRDDGPMPETLADVYKGQDRMRQYLSRATTVITMATTLHAVAAGNMTPAYRTLPDGTVRPVCFYCVDVAEFAVNKMADRGSLLAKGIVTNAQDFVVNLSRNLAGCR